MGQAQQCGGVKPVNGDPTNPPLLITGSPTFKYGVEVDYRCWKTSEFGVEVDYRCWRTSKYGVEVDYRCWKTSEYGVEVDYRCWKTSEHGVEVQCILDVGKRRSLVSK